MTAIDTAAPSTFRLTRTTAVLGAVGLSLLANLALWLVGLVGPARAGIVTPATHALCGLRRFYLYTVAQPWRHTRRSVMLLRAFNGLYRCSPG